MKLKLLSAAGGDPDASSMAAAGTSGQKAGNGGTGDAPAGAGGVPRLPPPNPCDEGTELELDQERELREAFVDAFESGRYCPNLSNAQRRELIPDRDLDWRARASICLTISSFNWVHVPRTQMMGWSLLDTPNLEDAKNALLGGDHTELCEEAERTQFRFVGVGHLYDVWTVFVSPGPQDDMQKP